MRPHSTKHSYNNQGQQIKMFQNQLIINSTKNNNTGKSKYFHNTNIGKNHAKLYINTANLKENEQYMCESTHKGRTRSSKSHQLQSIGEKQLIYPDQQQQNLVNYNKGSFGYNISGYENNNQLQINQHEIYTPQGQSRNIFPVSVNGEKARKRIFSLNQNNYANTTKNQNKKKIQIKTDNLLTTTDHQQWSISPHQIAQQQIPTSRKNQESVNYNLMEFSSNNGEQSMLSSKQRVYNNNLTTTQESSPRISEQPAQKLNINGNQNTKPFILRHYQKQRLKKRQQNITHDSNSTKAQQSNSNSINQNQTLNFKTQGEQIAHTRNQTFTLSKTQHTIQKDEKKNEINKHNRFYTPMRIASSNRQQQQQQQQLQQQKQQGSPTKFTQNNDKIDWNKLALQQQSSHKKSKSISSTYTPTQTQGQQLQYQSHCQSVKTQYTNNSTNQNLRISNNQKNRLNNLSQHINRTQPFVTNNSSNNHQYTQMDMQDEVGGAAGDGMSEMVRKNMENNDDLFIKLTHNPLTTNDSKQNLDSLFFKNKEELNISQQQVYPINKDQKANICQEDIDIQYLMTQQNKQPFLHQKLKNCINIDKNQGAFKNNQQKTSFDLTQINNNTVAQRNKVSQSMALSSKQSEKLNLQQQVQLLSCKNSSSFQKQQQIKDLNLTNYQQNGTNVEEIEQEIVDWSLMNLPISAQTAILKYKKYLTDAEIIEISNFKEIYYIGHSCEKKSQKGEVHTGIDDEDNNYIYKQFDHIAYRYEIIEALGNGSFGQVLKVFDHAEKEFYALKIVKNKQKFSEQAKIEINLLHTIRQSDDVGTSNIVKIQNNFIFRNHTCIITELLSINLYELMKKNKFNPLSLELIRRIAIQLLNSINYIHKLGIIHCDLKPENILLKSKNKSGIKIIDLGSSCFHNQQLYTYIQSRFYRAPEVMLGCKYNTEIDMWSFGCIIAELYMGYPIFPGENEQESIGYMNELLGLPPAYMLQNSKRKHLFYENDGSAKKVVNRHGEHLIPNSRSFYEVTECDDQNFLSFLQICLKWSPSERATPKKALLHSWIVDGLPEEIREQHIHMIQQEEQLQHSQQNSNCLSPLSSGREGTMEVNRNKQNLLQESENEEQEMLRQKLYNQNNTANYSKSNNNQKREESHFTINSNININYNIKHLSLNQQPKLVNNFQVEQNPKVIQILSKNCLFIIQFFQNRSLKKNNGDIQIDMESGLDLNFITQTEGNSYQLKTAKVQKTPQNDFFKVKSTKARSSTHEDKHLNKSSNNNNKFVRTMNKNKTGSNNNKQQLQINNHQYNVMQFIQNNQQSNINSPFNYNNQANYENNNNNNCYLQSQPSDVDSIKDYVF